MSAAILLALCLPGQFPVSVDCPDTVAAGSQFVFSISCSDPGCSSISTDPVFSDGLALSSSRSMRSTSSVNGAVQSTCRLDLIFQASSYAGGMQTVGPLTVRLGGGAAVLLPAESIFVAGPGAEAAEAAVRPSGRPLVIETVVRTDRIYPGSPFEVAYYLVSRIPVKSVETGWGPPENGAARLVSSPEFLAWEVSGSARRAHIITLEVTAASGGGIRLPVMSALVWEAGPLFFGDGPRHLVQGDTVRATVENFPAEGMPRDFGGIADSVSFSLTGQPAGERDHLISIEATGPGIRSMRSIPAPTASGPASILPLGGASLSGDTLRQRFLLVPGDTGLITAGGDSIPWFDPEEEVYRFAVVPACSVEVDFLPAVCDSAVSESIAADEDGPGALPAVIVVLAAASVVTLALVLARRRRSASGGVDEAGDVEELLSAFERGMAATLGGRRACLARDEALDLLSEGDIPLMLQRRVGRLWKDLEQALAVGEPGGAAFRRLKSECAETLAEVRRAYRRGN